MDFKALVENRHEYAKAWKAKTGGKVLGWFEPYFPEEVAYAAGVLPVRVLAKHEPDDVSDKWIYASCYPVRDMVNQFLKGRYDYMDGLVNVEGCQWMYNAFEVAVNNKRKPDLFDHYFFLPDHTDAPTSKHVTRSELNVFKGKMEEWTGKAITDADLDNAIEVYNKNRLLLKQISELRRMEKPVIHGAEMMNIVLADQVMDKAEMNGILEKFIPELEARAPGKDRIRLMLIGSETFDTELEELVEALGGDVVVDELDNGTGYYWNNIIPQKDRLMAIGLKYLGRPKNPIKDNNWRRRPQHIFELAEDYNVDGALVVKQIYCHLHGTDNYAVWKILRERYIPYHFFERDTHLPVEDTTLRLESFMNMLKPGINHLAGWHKVFGEE
jgi:benzoyl-CoA reductase subunit C